jgi:RNA recognition motif-containing protein
MNIYISNLRSEIGDNELMELFSSFGDIKSAQIVNDVFTGKSRGFGYVVMENNEEAKKAIEALNKTELQGLVITVEERPEKKEQQGSYKVGNSSVPGYRFRKS